MNPYLIFSALALVASASLAIAQPASEPDASGTSPSTDERLQQQEQQIRQLQERVRQLESAALSGSTATDDLGDAATPNAPDLGAVRETTEILNREELVASDFPGSWPMFGSDMRIKIGGYLKADFVYDFDGTLDKYQFLMSTIPVKGTPEYGNDGYTAFFAKETRINFDMRRTAANGVPLRGFLEGDFFSAGNQFRLRHAYISAGNFLFGQTWTTLSFLESLPFMIDFAAGDALFGGRSSQIRYTRAVSDDWKVSVAAEGLDLIGIDNPNGLPGQANAKLPLIAVRGENRWATGVLFLGASVAELTWDGGASGASDDALQWNIVVAGRQALDAENYITWNASYGDGSGENIIAFAGSKANAVLEANGRLETIPAFSLLLGFGHEWNSDWSSNFSYAYGWLDTPDTRDPLALKRGGVGHINLIWKPFEKFSTGIEYMWGAQRVQNDALGRAERLQFMAKFDF